MCLIVRSLVGRTTEGVSDSVVGQSTDTRDSVSCSEGKALSKTVKGRNADFRTVSASTGYIPQALKPLVMFSLNKAVSCAALNNSGNV